MKKFDNVEDAKEYLSSQGCIIFSVREQDDNPELSDEKILEIANKLDCRGLSEMSNRDILRKQLELLSKISKMKATYKEECLPAYTHAMCKVYKLLEGLN